MAIFHLNYLNQVQIAANTSSRNRAKSIIQRFPKSYEAPSKTSVPTAVMVLPPFFTSITSAVEISVVMVSFSMSVS